MPRLSWMTAAGVFLVLAGCAATAPVPPRDELAEAEKAIHRAELQEAAEFAALEMQMATDKLEQAHTILNTADAPRYDRAGRLAEQARLDAELAEVKAETARLKELREQLAHSVELLRDAPLQEEAQ